MSRRISLPGADELFRKTTLSAVPDQVEEAAEVVHTNRPTTATAKAAPKTNSVRQTPRRRGRIVREALSIVIADLESKGDQSIIARRLRGR